MKILTIKIAVATIAIPIAGFCINSQVWAEELVISGNGASANSEINVTTTSSTTVEQSNQANIQNNVDLNSNTGDNSASGNTGTGTQITTGDTNTQTSIENSANISIVSSECCLQSPSDVTITGNGENSQNTVNFNQNSDTNINTVQNANIQSNVNGYSNTGGNQANNNSGSNASITTGDISVNGKIENKNINLGSVLAQKPGGGGVTIKISGNGTLSNNLVNLSLNNNFDVNVDNTANILNNAIWNLITGDNQANGNTGGNVSITTGDISFITEIMNGPINTSKVVVDCCGGPDVPPPDDDDDDEDDDDDDNPNGGTPPTQPPVDQSKPPTTTDQGSTSPSNGQVLAAITAGQILPVSGMMWTVILSLASLLMFLFGLYLRLHPGRDPSKI